MTTASANGQKTKVFVIALLISLIWGCIEFGEPLDDLFKSAAEAIRSRPNDKSIVVVSVDDKTYAALGGSDYSREYDAKLIDRLFQLGAKTVSFDKLYSLHETPEGDRVMADALKRHYGSVFLGRYRSDEGDKNASEIGPIPEFANVAQTRYLNGDVGAFGLATLFPFINDMPRTAKPVGAALSGTNYTTTGYYRPDFSIQVSTIPTLSMIDVLTGNVRTNMIQGKDVLVGPTSIKEHDYHNIPLQGYVPGVYFHVIAAQTLKEHNPHRLGWLPFEIVSIFVSLFALRSKTKRTFQICCASVPASLILIPLVSQTFGYDFDITPGFAMSVPTLWATWLRRSKQRTKETNNSSGLPTIDVMKQLRLGDGWSIFCAKIVNYETICANLDEAADELLFSKITSRIRVEGGDIQFFHHHDTLMWCRPTAAPQDLEMHVAGLKRILSLPIDVGGVSVDIAIAIGVDKSELLPWHRRVGLALGASVTAAQTGSGTFVSERQTVEDRQWGLGLVSELERAIDNGEFFLEFQPKLEISTGRIIGAEALARWRHPERGLISPVVFIDAAERNNRIEKLTKFVITSAINASRSMIEQTPEFKIAVNVSARILRTADLLPYTIDALTQAGASTANLIFEITETSTLDNDAETLAALHAFQDVGITISIDDYGSGNANISYLTNVPATEIKIDKSFVCDIDTHAEHRIIVESTIALAHRLGWRVVAEGIETEAVLSLLTTMKCDVAQGYLIGKPMKMESLVDLASTLHQRKKRRRKSA